MSRQATDPTSLALVGKTKRIQKEQEGWSRRQFIANISGMGALMVVLPDRPHLLWGTVTDPNPRVALCNP